MTHLHSTDIIILCYDTNLLYSLLQGDSPRILTSHVHVYKAVYLSFDNAIIQIFTFGFLVNKR